MLTKKRRITRPPAYRQRKGYTQAIVTLRDAVTGRARDYWLGEYGSPASRELYHRIVAEWEARGRRCPDPDFGRTSAMSAGNPTVSEIIDDYWRWAKTYYSASHLTVLRPVIRLLRRFYGTTPAQDFGPSKLRLLRDEMIRGDAAADPPRRPWSRGCINMAVLRIRHVFKWAVARELVPASVYPSLCALEPLRRGRSPARETEKVGPAPLHLLDGVRRYLNRPVRTLIELQLLTGARPNELLGVRAVDIEMDERSGIWTYRPAAHKNAFRDRERVIYFGPRAQEVLRPFLLNRAMTAYLFSPAEAEEERRTALHEQRKTPLSCGNRPGTNRRAVPERTPSERYTPASYRRSIWYACQKAFPLPEHLQQQEDETRDQWRRRLTPAQKDEIRTWRRAHRFHPYQLRHNAATELRREFGLEAAQLAPGHASAQITDAVYAERDRAKVIEIMRKIG